MRPARLHAPAPAQARRPATGRATCRHAPAQLDCSYRHVRRGGPAFEAVIPRAVQWVSGHVAQDVVGVGVQRAQQAPPRPPSVPASARPCRAPRPCSDPGPVRQLEPPPLQLRPGPATAFYLTVADRRRPPKPLDPAAVTVVAELALNGPRPSGLEEGPPEASSSPCPRSTGTSPPSWWSASRRGPRRHRPAPAGTSARTAGSARTAAPAPRPPPRCPCPPRHRPRFPPRCPRTPSSGRCWAPCCRRRPAGPSPASRPG